MVCILTSFQSLWQLTILPSCLRYLKIYSSLRYFLIIYLYQLLLHL